MKAFMDKDFLLRTETARHLYHDYAAKQPIIDYHCHLSPKEIAEDKRYNNITEVWLYGDHYKWRAMRSCGVSEKFITGDASDYEKFRAYCCCMPKLAGNPLYHWSQVELEEFFGCTTEINAENAEAIWDECNAYILKNGITPQKLIESSNVKHIYTTNEVFDDLSTFEKIKEKGYKFTVTPAFRADKVMNIDAAGYKGFVEKLADLTHPIGSISDLEDALENRLNAFIKVGTKASDIAVERVCEVTTAEEADAVLKKALSGSIPTLHETEVFKGYLTYFLMKLYAKYNVATELHIGAMRNNNAVMLEKLGLDTGFDSISDTNSITLTSRLFDKLNSEGLLPKTIVFNLNPKMNSEIMTLIGAFQSDEARGKMQYGPAWWFLDNKVGMEQHLRDLTATGHIAVFVGMLTDSRSLLSYPRHHYFRRILCNYLGDMMEKGEMTNDIKYVGKVVENICYNNSVDYFGMER